MVSRVFLKNESVDGMTWGASAASTSSSGGVGEEGEQVRKPQLVEFDGVVEWVWPDSRMVALA